MMIGIRQAESVDRFGRVSKHDVLQMRCDVCGRDWEMRGSKTRVMSRKTHACSPKCKSNAHKPGGVVERLRAATNLERFGAENSFASEVCKEKIKTTLVKRFGVEHALQSLELREKFQNTMLDRYGVIAPSLSPELRAKQSGALTGNKSAGLKSEI